MAAAFGAEVPFGVVTVTVTNSRAALSGGGVTVIEVAESLTIDPGPLSPKFTDVALSRLVPEMTTCGGGPVAGPVFGVIASTIGGLEASPFALVGSVTMNDVESVASH